MDRDLLNLLLAQQLQNTSLGGDKYQELTSILMLIQTKPTLGKKAFKLLIFKKGIKTVDCLSQENINTLTKLFVILLKSETYRDEMVHFILTNKFIVPENITKDEINSIVGFTKTLLATNEVERLLSIYNELEGQDDQFNYLEVSDLM